MPTIVILAAGLGSRFGGNKQLVEFGEKKLTLMEYNLINAVNAGFNRVVFVIRPEIELLLQEQILARLPQGLAVEVVMQTLDNLPENCSVAVNRTKPLGTAHALWCCRKLLNESFAVINADDFYGAQAFDILLKQAVKTPNEHLMVAYRVNNTLSEYGSVNRGLCRLSNNKYLEAIEECEDIIQHKEKIIGKISKENTTVELAEQSLVSMNCWLFNIDIFPIIKEELVSLMQNADDLKAECYLPNVVMSQILQHHKRVKVLQTSDQWFGLTYGQDSIEVDRKIDMLFC